MQNAESKGQGRDLFVLEALWSLFVGTFDWALAPCR